MKLWLSLIVLDVTLNQFKVSNKCILMLQLVNIKGYSRNVFDTILVCCKVKIKLRVDTEIDYYYC